MKRAYFATFFGAWECIKMIEKLHCIRAHSYPAGPDGYVVRW